MTKNALEITFQNIVSIAHDATGSNAAFEPKYGMDTLNRIRIELGLSVIESEEEMEALLNY